MTQAPNPPVGEDEQTSLTLLARLGLETPDNEAWECFYSTYSPRIRRQCLRLGLSELEADEVVQDVSLKVREKVGTFSRERPRAFRDFLATHVGFAVKTIWRLRSQSRRIPGCASDVETIADPRSLVPETPEEPEAEGVLDELRAEFHKDPNAERKLDALCMRLVAGMPAKEVAEQLGMTEGAVNVLTYRMKQLLKAMLGPRFEDERR